MCDFAQCRIWFDYECDVWLIDAMAGQNTGKTVAIILGGAAGVAFLVICLMFARSLKKKRDGRLMVFNISQIKIVLFISIYFGSAFYYNNIIFIAQVIDSGRWLIEEA